MVEMTNETKLTPKQKKVLDFITSFSEKKGYAPSQQEIAKHFGFKSLGTVQNYLVRLERHGLLRKAWNARRGMEVIPSTTTEPVTGSSPAESAERTVPLPLVGEVAAGYPIEVIEDHQSIDVPSTLIQNGEHIALRVRGDSMIEDGILNEDVVIIKKQASAFNGQTVVALVDNEATIKRFYHRGENIELHPANSAYQPMVFGRESGLRIEGVLVGLIRQYNT